MNLWDERYSAQEYAFGKEPNVFFKSVLDTLTPGTILVPAAGEGRDAVYAATKGWKVYAVDASEKGKEKALALAKEHNVTIDYFVGDALQFEAPTPVDCIALIYFHLPSAVRANYHASLVSHLNTGGVVCIEAFVPEQIVNTSGGPKTEDMLYTVDSILSDFSMLECVQCTQEETVLNEGLYHIGKADVVRYIGVKK